MQAYSDFDAIKAHMDSSGGILSLEMRQLRDAYHVDRLGIHVRNGIHDKLAGLGIAHTPERLPEYQEDRVRLFTLGSPFAKALRDMSNYTAEADQRLRERFSTDASDCEQIIQRIKELLD